MTVEPSTQPADNAGEGPVMALVVDDNHANRMVLSLILEQIGCAVSLAEDGQQGVAAATEKPFNIVFMDLHMPTMDGFEATRLIRTSAGPNQSTPIVAVTADTTSDAEQRAREVGMTEYLAKPIDWAVIVDVLKRYLEDDETAH